MCHLPSCEFPPSIFGRSSQRLFCLSSRISFSFSSQPPFPSPLLSLRPPYFLCSVSYSPIPTTGTSLLDRHPRAPPLQCKGPPLPSLTWATIIGFLLGPALTLHLSATVHPRSWTPTSLQALFGNKAYATSPHLYGHKTSPSPNVEPDLQSPHRL
jgi:hypothetical protein